MKEILCLTGDYHPCPNAPGVCLENIFEEFVKGNLEVISAVSFKKPCPSQIEYRGYRIHYIQNDYYKKRENVKNKRIPFLVLRIAHAMSVLANQYTYDKTLVETYLNKIKEFKSIDTILAVCLPIEAVIAAIEYTKNNDKCKVICIFFDNYANNPGIYRTSLERKIKFKNNLELEKKIFESATKVFYISTFKQHFQTYLSQYKFKSEEIGLPLLKIIHENEKDETKKNNKITVTFAGSVNKKNRNPEIPLKEFVDLVKERGIPMRISFYSNGNANDIIERYERLYPDIIKKNDYVSSERIIEIYKESDILLSIGNRYFEVGLPSKIFQYMSIRKPIIHFYYNIKDPVLDILKHYTPSLCLDINSFEVIALEKFVMGISLKEYRKSSKADMDNYYHEYLPSVVADKIFYEI